MAINDIIGIIGGMILFAVIFYGIYKFAKTPELLKK